jgi:hypothetical protein
LFQIIGVSIVVEMAAKRKEPEFSVVFFKTKTVRRPVTVDVSVLLALTLVFSLRVNVAFDYD